MYTPTFAVSFINTKTGTGVIDCGNSNLKTAKGAAKNWYKTCGHFIGFFICVAESLDDLAVVVRPIDSADDLVNFNMTGNTGKYMAREKLHGSTVLAFTDIYN